ncbi:proline racemase family protein [Nocardioides panacis]|uniref:Proline racemase family protein n=1 Tax=Nocardioides panacis TaxID=2849501 RepID=A0A975T3G4_9ACTN|nr:proline racemase family protein [Nocardioides panacis]
MPSRIATTDYHTGGEPFRIVVDPPVPIPGATVAERRARAIEDPEVQGLRRVLCSEPRGHADMYGGFLVPPDDDAAHLGVLFWHKDGFSTACGHGTMALGVWAVESGLVAAPETGSVDVVIDVPSGRVSARVHRERARVVSVDFVNVPSWVIATDVAVPTSRGELRVDVAFGGAVYATLPAAQVGLSVTPGDLGELVALGREIRRALDGTEHAVHPSDPRLSGVYGTIWFDDLGGTEGLVHQRNVTVFADGEVDRSPCGSGTCARLAVLAADGRLPSGTVLRHDSVVGSTFTGTVLGTVEVGGRPAVLPQVTGTAYRTGQHEFCIDPSDPMVPGFQLR